MPRVVAMAQVDEDPTTRREQPAALPQHLDAGGSSGDVAEHVPQADDHVEAGLELVQVFGAERQ